jgi:hypothetical protein
VGETRPRGRGRGSRGTSGARGREYDRHSGTGRVYHPKKNLFFSDRLETLKKLQIKLGAMKLLHGNQQFLLPKQIVMKKRKMSMSPQLPRKMLPPQKPKNLRSNPKSNPKRKKITLKHMLIGLRVKPSPTSKSVNFENLIKPNGKLQHLS